MTIELHNTVMGKRLIEGTLPDIADSLKSIAKSLDTSGCKIYVKVKVWRGMLESLDVTATEPEVEESDEDRDCRIYEYKLSDILRT